MNNEMIRVENSISFVLSKEELISIFAEIADPFYSRVKADHRTNGLIKDDSYLFRLKIRQVVFIIRFFSQPLSVLHDSMARAGEVHGKIGLDFGIFARYFTLYADLAMLWIKKHKNPTEEELLLWQAKLFALFSAIGHAYDGKLGLVNNLDKSSSLSVDLEILASMHSTQKISAKAFVESSGGIDWDLVGELKELAIDVENEIGRGDTLDEKMLISLEKLFSAFSSILNSTYEFKELGYALESLFLVLKSIDINALDSAKHKKIKLFLESVIKDLDQWQDEVFVKMSTQDIHYLDASLFSSCAQLEALLIPEKAIDHDDELELF